MSVAQRDLLALPDRRHVAGTVLVATPDTARTGALARALVERGALATVAFTGQQVLSSLDSHDADLLVLDTLLAGATPASFVKAVRARSEAPLLLIGLLPPAVSPLLDAAVHVAVPAGTHEAVIAGQAAALLGLMASASVHVIHHWGPLELDVGRRQARWHGRPLDVTPLQFRILSALVLAQGDVVTKRELHRLVWGSGVVDDGERVAAHIKRIRAKLGEQPSKPSFLLTVRGEGYRLAD